jgi:hypothetical protein
MAAKINIVKKSEKPVEKPIEVSVKQEAPAKDAPIVEAKLGEEPPVRTMEVQPKPEAPKQAKIAQPAKTDKVKIQVLRHQAAPEIGNFSFLREFQVNKIHPMETYMVPPYVASHLQMTKVAVRVL